MAAFVLTALLHGFGHADWWRDIPMGIVWSLFYGLPLAALAYKRDLESAMAFHWFINFGQAALGLF